MPKVLFLIFIISPICIFASVPKNNSRISDFTDMTKGELESDISEGLTYKDLYRDYITIDQKWLILKRIRKGNPEFASKVYLTSIKSLDWVLRSGGIQFLASLNPSLARSKALELLKNDPALMVRSTALQTLEKIGIENHKDILWATLRDSKNFHKGQSLWIRKDIAKNLINLTDQTDLLSWSILLSDKDSQIVNSSIKALEKNSGLIMGQADSSLEAKAQLWKNKFNLN